MTAFPFLTPDDREKLRGMASAARRRQLHLESLSLPTTAYAVGLTYAQAVEDVLRYVAGDTAVSDELAAVLNTPNYTAAQVYTAPRVQPLTSATCRHCGRVIVRESDGWVDPAAGGDDLTWRATCDAHDTFTAEHEPADTTRQVHVDARGAGTLCGLMYSSLPVGTWEAITDLDELADVTCPACIAATRES